MRYISSTSTDEVIEHTPRTRMTNRLAIGGLLIALLVVSCLFTIPFGSVPFTLQTVITILIALVLSPRQAAVVCCIYLLMGAIGLPVFSGMTGGFGKFLGPTGGFLMSYPIATACGSSLRRLLQRKGRPQIIADICAAIVVIAVADIIGWLWFMYVTGADPLSSFLISDAPYIVIDACKGAVAIVLAQAIRKTKIISR